MLPLVPPSVPAPLIPLFSRISGLESLAPVYEAERHHAEAIPFCRGLLAQLGITVRVDSRDWRKIPSRGPVIFVANHPFGLLEAWCWLRNWRRASRGCA